MAGFFATFIEFVILDLVSYNKEAKQESLSSCIKYISQRERQKNMTMLERVYGQHKMELVFCFVWGRESTRVGEQTWEEGEVSAIEVYCMKLLNN